MANHSFERLECKHYNGAYVVFLNQRTVLSPEEALLLLLLNIVIFCYAVDSPAHGLLGNLLLGGWLRGSLSAYNCLEEGVILHILFLWLIQQKVSN